MSGRVAAQNLVEDIVKDHGYIRASTINGVGKMSQEWRREIEDAILKKDQLIGANIITLARNLYSSNARFVFELLQNADDNHFSKAFGSNQLPFVSFDLHLNQRRIVVECNEDGFTKANLVAISNLGQSSKSGAQAYIGEKGIGFKSIFKVAYKVLIQSGDFKFSFNHKKGDSGMGMICPEWEPDVPFLDSGSTRMTLFLHEDDQDGNQAQDIRDQFKDLHPEMLLFLKNLRRIVVRIFDEEDDPEATTTYRVLSASDNRMETETVTEKGGNTESERKYFHVTKYMATDLPRGETRNYAQAEVVVAFPLSVNSVPLEEDQSVFAFLPLCEAGFNFILHADFVTTANRQDVETTSPRNKKLIKGIADAFVKGVTQLCQHESLQYQWMRYVPSTENKMSRGAFWGEVVATIRSALQYTPLLRPASLGRLRLIGDLKNISPKALDESWSPLFEDITPEIYLSSSYTVRDTNILVNLGLQYARMQHHIDRVRSDLSSSRSRFKQSTNKDWHSRVARLLAVPFQMDWKNHVSQVKELSLIPLNDGSWTSSHSGLVYYPETHGIEIPAATDVRLLLPTACSDEDRRVLFNHLGAQEATIQLIRNKILQRYKGSYPHFSPNISMAHLIFLYRSHRLAGESIDYTDVMLVTQPGEEMTNPFAVDTYLPCANELGVSKLLSPIPAGLGNDAGAPGFKVHFVDDVYLNDTPDRPSEQSLTWSKWLCQCLNLRTNIRLVNKLGDCLSDACLYVAKHRPQKFLSLLHAEWPTQRQSILGNAKVLQELRSIKVLCQDGHYQALAETYMPTESYKADAARFLGDNDIFPWLYLEESSNHLSNLQKWHTIAEDLEFGFCGTGYRTDVDFGLDILKSVAHDGSLVSEDPSLPERVYGLYLFLDAKVGASRIKNTETAKVRAFFNLEFQASLYVPLKSDHEFPWHSPSDCVWHSPLAELEFTYPLETLYSQYFEQFKKDHSLLKNFFQETLQIVDCSWEHLVKSLEWESPSLDRAISLYTALDEMELVASEERVMKEAFATKPLICSIADDPPSWHPISGCLWQSATRIPGKTPLNNKNDYDDLKDFFLRRLGVPTMTIDMLYGKLKGSHAAAIEEVKGDLLEFSALLPTSKKSFDPNPVRTSSIFPVRLPNGEVELLAAKDEFAIADRKHFAEDFAGKVAFLDFDMGDFQRLRAFLEWAGLEDRYLSRSVKEISTADKASTRPLSEPDRAIHRKAHALLRIATHYDSPRAQDQPAQEALYNKMRNSQTLETQNINTTLLLSQDGQSYSVDKSTGNAVQIVDNEGQLTIFLPRNKKDREICFSTKLTRCFLDWMMDYPTSMPNRVLKDGSEVLHAILTTPTYTLDGVLEDRGINDTSVGEHDVYDDPEEENDEANRSVSSDDFELVTPSNSPPAASAPAQMITAPLRVQADPQPRVHVAYSSPPPIYRQPTEVASTQYHNLLGTVVAAGRRAEIPSRGAFNMSQMQANLDGAVEGAEGTDDYFVLRYTDRLERDKMIGAAGEVFTFEMLSRLDPSLPGFGRDSWQSTIRHYVKGHRDYADLERWVGRETADITYSDTTGAFTALLADKGYLDLWNADDIAQARPQYFVEVKATTGPCETPFYMSKHQYQRMQQSSQTRAEAGQQLDCVYVIFRVYNLGRDSIGVRVLVDPEGLRQRGGLQFTAESWSVSTGTSVR